MTALRENDVEQLLRPMMRSRTVLDPVRHTPATGAPTTRELVATRFGGLPTGQEGERWPTCAGCANDLTFVAQVDNARDALHDKLPISFFTFFYCWNCHPWGKDSEQGQWLVRAYTKLTRPQVLEHTTTDVFAERYAQTRLEMSLPDGVGMKVHCPELWERVPGTSGGRKAWANWAVIDRVALALTRERARKPDLRNAGVAIGGFPMWVNGPDETPRCADCMGPMELLLQIRPTELTDAGWGDVGTLYLFMCRTHPQRTGLRIQCT